jgi:hypothetical protein
MYITPFVALLRGQRGLLCRFWAQRVQLFLCFGVGQLPHLAPKQGI